MGDRIDEFLETVVQVLPPHPSQLESNEDIGATPHDLQTERDI